MKSAFLCFQGHTGNLSFIPCVPQQTWAKQLKKCDTRLSEQLMPFSPNSNISFTLLVAALNSIVDQERLQYFGERSYKTGINTLFNLLRKTLARVDWKSLLGDLFVSCNLFRVVLCFLLGSAKRWFAGFLSSRWLGFR